MKRIKRKSSPSHRNVLLQKPCEIVLPAKPVLRFSPTSWAKLLYFRDHQETEVGGFGLSSPENLLFLEDFVTVRQEVTAVSVAFDDDAVADFFDHQVDSGRKPEQFARVWLHTHPGDSPFPSSTDEQTFARVFGRCQWAVMFILARNGETLSRLRFNIGPGGEVSIPVEVDFTMPFGPSDHEAWELEYKANVRTGKWDLGLGRHETVLDDLESCEWLDRLEVMDPEEQKTIINRLAARYDYLEDEEDE